MGNFKNQALFEKSVNKTFADQDIKFYILVDSMIPQNVTTNWGRMTRVYRKGGNKELRSRARHVIQMLAEKLSSCFRPNKISPDLSQVLDNPQASSHGPAEDPSKGYKPVGDLGQPPWVNASLSHKPIPPEVFEQNTNKTSTRISSLDYNDPDLTILEEHASSRDNNAPLYGGKHRQSYKKNINC